MDPYSLNKSISEYKEQLKQINLALSSIEEGVDKNDLLSLKSDIEQLIQLTKENLLRLEAHNEQASTSKSDNPLDDEYMLFMKEMEAEGCIQNNKKKKLDEELADVEKDLKALEGMKCQAPHCHSWGNTVYHNALVCGTVNANESQSFMDIKVRVMFTNPTHKEMLPCPYYLEDSNCKFSDEQCHYSHGEIVLLSSLQEYKEPDFQNVKTGSKVLAKNSDKLWHRAIVKKINKDSCLIKYESNQKDICVPLHDILPLNDGDKSETESSDSDSESNDDNNDWIIQKSLLNTPTQILGDWEKHTKGIGSKLMQQMGYVVGTGLGRNADGRLDPVEAIVLPSGKSLDHCMNLREMAGGDENLFSTERRLKRQQKKQETQNKKAYEREKQKTDVFEFLNNTLSKNNKSDSVKENKNKKEEIKTGSNRDLNVTSLKIDEDMKKIEYQIYKIKESLNRHKDENTIMHTSLKAQLLSKQTELNKLKVHAQNVKQEQIIRKDKRKLTVF